MSLEIRELGCGCQISATEPSSPTVLVDINLPNGELNTYYTVRLCRRALRSQDVSRHVRANLDPEGD